jgi:AbrB family looped-hinge helix DNA binding protein
MSTRTIPVEKKATITTVSRIGQRRQVVIPKKIFDELALVEGDFMEVTVENGRVAMKRKKLVDADDTLTTDEAKTVRRGEAQLKRGESKPWRAVKHALAR